MGAAAAGFLVMIATAITLGIIIGGISGIVTARARLNPILSTLVSALLVISILYLLDMFIVVTASAVPLMLTFLLTYFSVNYLNNHKKSVLWPTLAGITLMLVVYGLCVILVRTSLFPTPAASLWLAGSMFLLLVISYLSGKHGQNQTEI